MSQASNPSSSSFFSKLMTSKIEANRKEILQVTTTTHNCPPVLALLFTFLLSLVPWSVPLDPIFSCLLEDIAPARISSHPYSIKLSFPKYKTSCKRKTLGPVCPVIIASLSDSLCNKNISGITYTLAPVSLLQFSLFWYSIMHMLHPVVLSYCSFNLHDPSD